MKKYRKLPVIIEAMQWSGNVGLQKINEFVGKELPVELLSDTAYDAGMGLPSFNLKIETLEGVMTVSPKDFIIKGVNGEFYPCKPDIFKRTYEEVDTD